MTNQVVLKDIGALKEFASRLDRAQQDLVKVASDLQSALNKVGQSWQDPQKDRCAQEIDQLRGQLAKFANVAQQQVSYCRKLASHIESTPHA